VFEVPFRNTVVVISAIVLSWTAATAATLLFAFYTGLKRCRDVYTFAFGGSILTGAIAYIALMPTPVSHGNAMRTALSVLGLGLFFDTWKWSEGAPESLMANPPDPSTLPLAARSAVFYTLYTVGCIIGGFYCVIKRIRFLQHVSHSRRCLAFGRLSAC
jgi:hypothetical protein